MGVLLLARSSNPAALPLGRNRFFGNLETDSFLAFAASGFQLHHWLRTRVLLSKDAKFTVPANHICLQAVYLRVVYLGQVARATLTYTGRSGNGIFQKKKIPLLRREFKKNAVPSVLAGAEILLDDCIGTSIRSAPVLHAVSTTLGTKKNR